MGGVLRLMSFDGTIWKIEPISQLKYVGGGF